MSVNFKENIEEAELEDKLEKFLSKWFNVERQVWSESGNSRIDIVAVHKSDIKKEYPFGIEVKDTKKKRGLDIALWFLQSIRYTKENFLGYGKCIILICPPISGHYFVEGSYVNNHNGCHPHKNVSTFLGHFGIGEVQKCSRYKLKRVIFAYNSSIFWSSGCDRLNINMIEKRWKKKKE